MTDPHNSNDKASRSAGQIRADARRNRVRILEAADAVFATNGMTASTEEVARRAGVGIGTVFRHYPTKESLMEAVLVRRSQRLAEESLSLCEDADPGQAFFTFFTHMVNQSVAKNAFAEAGADMNKVRLQVGDDFMQIVDTLLARAQQAGAVRADVGVNEVIALIIGTARAAEHVDWNQEILEQILRIIFDGIQSTASQETLGRKTSQKIVDKQD